MHFVFRIRSMANFWRMADSIFSHTREGNEIVKPNERRTNIYGAEEHKV